MTHPLLDLPKGKILCIGAGFRLEHFGSNLPKCVKPGVLFVHKFDGHVS